MMKRQTGVGLVEVLVALVLLSIAVLGFVALQIRAITASNEATMNVQATTYNEKSLLLVESRLFGS